MRRCCIFLCGWLLALTAFGATPEVGKDALRKLVRMPSITFESAWTFDAEHGFTLGSHEHDTLAEISRLRLQLRHDPSDAELQLRIGDLYSRINDHVSARKACGRAAEYFRQRVEAQPDDALLLAGFGRALQGAGKSDEAESVLRKAVAIAPKEWHCHVALGRFLDADARRNLSSEHLSSSRVALARRQLDEAGKSFEEGVKLAPKEGEVYFRRGMHRSISAMLLNEIRIADGEPRQEVLAANGQFSQAALDDLKQASRLRPNDFALMGNVALFEIYTINSREGRMNWADFSLNSLPEQTQRSIRGLEARLESLGQDPDPRTASGALEVLGILQGPVLREPGNCIATLRRAVAIDPSCEQAWDILAANLARSRRFDELVAICEDRVRRQESARSHLMLAKAFEKTRQWEASENEILETLRLEPNNFTANLAEAALILRRNPDDNGLTDANNWLSRSERLLGDVPLGQRNQLSIIELTLTRSIYFALTDQLDEARQWANAVIRQDKNNPVAQEILTAMDY